MRLCDLIRRLSLPLLAATLLAIWTGAPTAARAEPAPRTIIVLDGSGSMWGEIDGRRKLDTAREVVGRVVSSLPADRALGLMAYGHRRKGDCSDIELIVPPAPGTAPAVLQAVRSMRFVGKTPLSEAVRQAAEALDYTQAPATVVLVTDGLETCAADPCAVATELEAAGVGFTAHVIGFGLTRTQGAQVACIAEKTGGRYLPARDGAALAEALTATVGTPPTAAPPAATPPAKTYFPGAPLMPHVALEPTGQTTSHESKPLADKPFPPTGTIAQCQAACADDMACLAWRYEPKGSYFVDHARCFTFPASSEFDLRTFPAEEGWASGIKEGHSPLVRPYLITVTFSAEAEGAPISWSAAPMPGPQALPPEAWAAEEERVEPVEAALLPGAYRVTGTVTEGPLKGTVFSAPVTVAPTGTVAFTIPRAP